MKFLPNFRALRRMSLLVRQNFSEECEKEINRQINMELTASYEYMAMAWYFDRTDVALPGLTKWCKKNCDDEKLHAEKLMTYLNKRGGILVLKDIEKPKFSYESVMKSLIYALDLEKKVNESLLKVHAVATENNDPNLCDFLESEYLQEQVDAMKEISDYIRQIERAEKELGVYVFDIKFNENKKNVYKATNPPKNARLKENAALCATLPSYILFKPPHLNRRSNVAENEEDVLPNEEGDETD